MELLSEEQIEQELEKLSNWKRIDEKWIRRRYKFENYLLGIEFVSKVAAYAEESNTTPILRLIIKL